MISEDLRAATVADAEMRAAIEPLGPHAEIVRPAAVIAIEAEPFVDIRAFPGTVQPARASRLAFRVGGPLVELPVREGDIVEAGALLGLIDQRDFALAVAELEARLSAAQAARRLAELDYQRRSRLVETQAISRAELDRAVAERDRTSAEEASVAQQLAIARAALKDTRLEAPFEGRVARLHVELFDYIDARAPALTFHDTSATDFVVDLPERVIDRLSDLDRIAVELSDRDERAFEAIVHEIASEQATDTGTYRTTLRKVGFNGPAPLAGMSGTAYLHFHNGRSGTAGEILVPSTALFRGADGLDAVWVVDGDPLAVTARRVETAGVFGDRVRIVEGLHEGDRIVAYGVDFLAEGQRIRALDEPLFAETGGGT